MFNRTHRTLARWVMLCMGSILVIFAGVIYAQRVADRLVQHDRLLYKKAQVMAANIHYELRSSRAAIDLRPVPFLGQYSPPADSEIVYVRWYSPEGNLHQFYGLQPTEQMVATAAFETIAVGSEQLRQLTLPVRRGEQVIGYLQMAMPLTQTQNDLQAFLRVLVLAVGIALGWIGLASWFLAGLALQPIQQAYDQLQRFSADASHELRAPLAAILSNAQVGLLAPAAAGADKDRRLENIVQTAKSMAGLIGDLLFLARQVAGLTPAQIESVNLNQLLTETLAAPPAQLPGQGQRLSLDLPAVPIWVQGNPELLRQALLNLLTNACQYTPPEGHIGVRLLSKSYGHLIQVEDTGLGIPAADLPHVFERFYRVDRERARTTGGTGLGLAIAQQIVEAHGGRLSVTSQIGKGTRFQIELPL